MQEGTREARAHLTIPAPADAVWDTWVTPDLYDLVHDTVNTTIDLRVGGRLATGPDFEAGQGEAFVYSLIELERTLVFAWEGQEESPVTVEFHPAGGETEVVITQGGIDDESWARHQTYAWTWVLESLRSYFATGKGIPCREWWAENVPADP